MNGENYVTKGLTKIQFITKLIFSSNFIAKVIFDAHFVAEIKLFVRGGWFNNWHSRLKGNQNPHIKFNFIIKYSLLRTTSESLNKIRQRIRKLQLFEI